MIKTYLIRININNSIIRFYHTHFKVSKYINSYKLLKILKT